jgi:hypothetical protein
VGQDKTGSNIYWLTKGQGIKAPSTLNTDPQLVSRLKSMTIAKRNNDSNTLGLKLQPLENTNLRFGVSTT